MEDEKWIISDSDHLGGKARVRGTRISVAFLLECLASGMSVAEIDVTYMLNVLLFGRIMAASRAGVKRIERPA